MSKIHMTPRWKDVKPSGHYVYIHFRATDMSPFYVGMGQNGRGWQFTDDKRTEWWFRTAKKSGVVISIAQDGLSFEQACTLEMWLIAKLRHEGERLVNLSSGGSGKRDYGRVVYSSDGASYRTLQDAANHMKDCGWPLSSAAAIHNCASGKTRVSYDRKWSFSPMEEQAVLTTKQTKSSVLAERNKRPVLRSDGLLYESLDSAVSDLQKYGHQRANKSALCMVCKGKRKSAYGYGWSYA